MGPNGRRRSGKERKKCPRPISPCAGFSDSLHTVLQKLTLHANLIDESDWGAATGAVSVQCRGIGTVVGSP